MTYWITHRQPTAADADGDGDVSVPRYYPEDDKELYVFYQYVGAGVPWMHSDCYRGVPPVEPQAVPVPPPVVRTFRHVSGLVAANGSTYITAVADDGTAWYRQFPSNRPQDGEWLPHPPLPQPNQPGE